MKVLLLESDFAVSQMLAASIRAKLWQVFFATDAEYALPVALKISPDVVVIDGLLMGSAIRALEELRSSVHTAAVPIIAISNPDGTDPEEFLRAGVQKCFAPPIDPGRIMAEIELQVAARKRVELAPEAVINDPVRLAALEGTGLLDSEPEECFDALTALAAKLLDAPTALMSLVDNERQFFKSQYGLGEPWSSQRQTPLSHSFCQWVVSEEKDLIVGDAREHSILRNNGALHDLGVIAYAGVPLSVDSEHTVGSFCTVDSKPHEWTAADMDNLSDLAKIVNAFVVVQMVKNPELSSAADISPTKVVQSASDAIAGATSILGRGGERLGVDEQAQLKGLIRNWSEELQTFASGSL